MPDGNRSAPLLSRRAGSASTTGLFSLTAGRHDQKEVDACVAEAQALIGEVNDLLISTQRNKNKWTHAFGNQVMPVFAVSMIAAYVPAVSEFLDMIGRHYVGIVMGPVNALIGYFGVGAIHNSCAPPKGVEFSLGDLPGDQVDAREIVTDKLIEAKAVLLRHRDELRGDVEAIRKLKVETGVLALLNTAVGFMQEYAPEALVESMAPMGPALPLAMASVAMLITMAVERCRDEVKLTDELVTRIDGLITAQGLELSARAPRV